MAKLPNTQRALWSVLISSLAAPAMAAVVAVVLWLGQSLAGITLLPSGAATAGEVGLRAFAWSALPATVAALALTPYVLNEGTYGWLHAAVAGVVAFGAAAIIFPLSAGPFMPVLAFGAGLIGLGVRLTLIRIGVLTA